MAENRSRQLWAVARTAAMWGAAWAAAGGSIAALLTLFNPGPGVESLIERLGLAAIAGVSWGVRFALAGAVVGAVFAGVIRWGYQGRRLAQINPVRFTLLGAVIGGVGVPLYLQLMNVLSDGHPIAWGLVTDDSVWASAFGAIVAAGMILLARRAEARAPTPVAMAWPDELEEDLVASLTEPAPSMPDSTPLPRDARRDP